MAVKDETLARMADACIELGFPVQWQGPSPIDIPIGRNKDFPRLLNKLGMTNGAEVGVYKADYSLLLKRHIPGLRLFCVDPWMSYRGFKDFGKHDIDVALDVAAERLAGDWATILHGFSTDMAKEVPDGSLDFVFIDANHDYPHCVEDIAAWDPKVRSGGIVFGHDYDDYSQRSRWKQMHVVDAVNGWVRSFRIEPWFVLSKHVPGKCWMYVKE